MVKRRPPHRHLPERFSVRAPGPVLEALESRLEAAFVLPPLPPCPQAACGHGPISPATGSLCGCLGTLCLCDGQDCVGICERHCVLDYA